MVDDNHQVGGRPGDPAAPGRGGGYLDTCSQSGLPGGSSVKFFAKNLNLTVDDFEKMGLSGKWLEIARRIGVDNWLDVWEILDRENVEQPSHIRCSLRLRVPMFSRVGKMVRNKLIHQMRELPAKEIQKELQRHNLEAISIITINEIKKESRGDNEK